MNIKIDITEDDMNEHGIRQLFLAVLSLAHGAEVSDPFNVKFGQVHEELQDARQWLTGDGDPDYQEAAVKIGWAFRALTGDRSLMDKAYVIRRGIYGIADEQGSR
jgi:hypothetical protein